MIMFSPKQKLFVKKAKKKLNIAYGSVRTGKTIITTIAFLLHVIGFKQRQHFAIVGKTRDTVRRNVIPIIEQYLGEGSFTYTITRDEIDFLGHKIFVLGANDEKAETRIRGLTLAGALCDEVTTYPRSVFEQLLARNSVEGAKIFATTNPDSPYHWLYTEYIQKADEKGYFVMKFVLEDNPFLPPEYIEFIKKTYTGLFYKRFILGEWVAAEGIIYDMFDEKVHIVEELPDRFDKYIVGIDFGMQNPTVFLLVGAVGDTLYVIREFYHEGRERTMTVDAYSQAFKNWLDGIRPWRIWIDPSAQALMQQLIKDGYNMVREANNDVISGIATVSMFLHNKKLFIHSSCKNTIREFYSYAWDAKAQQNGQDKPLKVADHCMDALRYALHSEYPLAKQVINKVIDKPRGW